MNAPGVVVSIPPTLRQFCGGAHSVHVQAGTVATAIAELHGRFNGIRERLMDDRGEVRGSVLVFVNQEDIRFLKNGDTALQPGDEVSIVPAFAGG